MAQRVQPYATAQGNAAALRPFLESFPSPVLLLDGQRVASVNDLARQLFGVDACRLIGRPLREILQAQRVSRHDPRHSARDHRVLKSTPLERTFERPDGTSGWVVVSSSRLEATSHRCLLVVLHDVTDLKRTEQNLLRSRDQWRRVVGHLDTQHDAERARIARQVHDGIQQSLAAIRMQIGRAMAQIRPCEPKLATTLQEIDSLALQAIDSSRGVIDALQGPILEDLGLAEALEALLNRFAHRTGKHCRLERRGIGPDEQPHAPQSTSSLLRVTAQWLGAIESAAAPCAVKVVLERRDDDWLALHLSVAGSPVGAGESPGTDPGMLAARQRLRRLGGTLLARNEAADETGFTALLPDRATQPSGPP